MNLPLVPYGVASLGGLTDWLRTLATSIAAGWNVEHTATGTHDWHWTTPAFDANRFRGDGTVTWTVESSDRSAEWYGVLGDLMVWSLSIGVTSTGGVASRALNVTIPGGYRSVDTFLSAAAIVSDAGTNQAGYVQGSSDAAVVEIRQVDGGTWSNAASGNTAVYFTICFRVTR